MADGYIPTEEFNDQLRRLVRESILQLHLPRDPRQPRPMQNGDRWGVTTSEIAAATDAMTDPGSGTVKPLRKDNETGNLVDPNIPDVTVTWRAENITIAADTLVRFGNANGELTITWADCDAMSNPP